MNIPHKNWLEWIVFAAGLLLVLGTVGYLGVQALTDGRSPAALSVMLGQPWAIEGAGHHVVPVIVQNDGGHSAAEVTIEVELTGQPGGQPPERRELTFAYVPHGSSRAGALTFEHRPAPGDLRVRVLGYLEP
jgi:uncharacterized protein (TIGR02588 family)